MEPKVAVVIPGYNVARHLPDLIPQIPRFIDWIIVVNDASKDDTGAVLDRLAKADRRVIPVTHAVNGGVGAALATGFREALKTEAQIVVKVDGDGQMDPAQIARLIRPLLDDRADFTKGNRFRHMTALRSMPLVRRLGNLGLSFAVKLGSGYWRSFDPCNGFVAIRREVLQVINLEQLSPRYFFEISLLGQLSLVGAVVRDVSMPAVYGNETSHLRVKRILAEFPRKLAAMTLRRMIYRKMAFDFTMDGLYLLAGVPLTLFALIFGSLKWYQYASEDIPAPTGTIMIATLALVVGVQFIIAAISLDILSEPTEPISSRWLEPALPEARPTNREAS